MVSFGVDETDELVSREAFNKHMSLPSAFPFSSEMPLPPPSIFHLNEWEERVFLLTLTVCSPQLTKSPCFVCLPKVPSVSAHGVRMCWDGGAFLIPNFTPSAHRVRTEARRPAAEEQRQQCRSLQVKSMEVGVTSGFIFWLLFTILQLYTI